MVTKTNGSKMKEVSQILLSVFRSQFSVKRYKSSTFFLRGIEPTQKKKPPNPRSKLRGFKKVLDKAVYNFFSIPVSSAKAQLDGKSDFGKKGSDTTSPTYFSSISLIPSVASVASPLFLFWSCFLFNFPSRS